jgi:hypothetical protein
MTRCFSLTEIYLNCQICRRNGSISRSRSKEHDTNARKDTYERRKEQILHQLTWFDLEKEKLFTDAESTFNFQKLTFGALAKAENDAKGLS